MCVHDTLAVLGQGDSPVVRAALVQHAWSNPTRMARREPRAALPQQSLHRIAVVGVQSARLLGLPRAGN